MPLSFDDLLRNRLPHVGLKSINRGGGDCWWHCIAAEAGISLKDLRSGVAQHMHENEHVYGQLGNFDAYGGYQNYCDLVGPLQSLLRATPKLLQPPILHLGTFFY